MRDERGKGYKVSCARAIQAWFRVTSNSVRCQQNSFVLVTAMLFSGKHTGNRHTKSKTTLQSRVFTCSRLLTAWPSRPSPGFYFLIHQPVSDLPSSPSSDRRTFTSDFSITGKGRPRRAAAQPDGHLARAGPSAALSPPAPRPRLPPAGRNRAPEDPPAPRDLPGSPSEDHVSPPGPEGGAGSAEPPRASARLSIPSFQPRSPRQGRRGRAAAPPPRLTPPPAPSTVPG